jgi:hypothetical protein
MHVETAIKRRAYVAKIPVDTAALDRDRAYIHIDDIVGMRACRTLPRARTSTL